RRVSRPNPPDTWVVTEATDLGIVPNDMFQAAQARLAARAGVRPEKQRRARHLLSGLLRCAACGSGMSIYGRERGDRRRGRCRRAAESGTCPDPKTFSLDKIETAVLGALREELRHPDVIAEFVRTYHQERKRLAASDDTKRAASERRLGQVRRELDRVIDG